MDLHNGILLEYGHVGHILDYSLELVSFPVLSCVDQDSFCGILLEERCGRVIKCLHPGEHQAVDIDRCFGICPPVPMLSEQGH